MSGKRTGQPERVLTTGKMQPLRCSQALHLLNGKSRDTISTRPVIWSGGDTSGTIDIKDRPTRAGGDAGPPSTLVKLIIEMEMGLGTFALIIGFLLNIFSS